MDGLYIGELAARTTTSRATIRYYERIGLLPAGGRTASGYRVYSQAAVTELNFVRRAQALGFALDEIREFLRLHRRGVSPCERVVAVAHQRLRDVEQRLTELMQFRDHLAEQIRNWTACDQVPEPERLKGPCALIECKQGATCRSDPGRGSDCDLQSIASRSGLWSIAGGRSAGRTNRVD